MKCYCKIWFCLVLISFIFTNVGCKKTPPKLLPSLSTAPITNLTSSSVVSGGSVLSDGNAVVTARGVCWGENENPTISNNKTSDGSGIGTFTSTISGLSPGKLYFLRAYATNIVGTAYGNQISLTTTSILPTVSTTEVSEISSSSAKSGGNITDDGGSPVTLRGVCWSLNQNPTTKDSVSVNGTGIGIFSSNITSLVPGATYFVRAYATNSIGTIYGNQLSFNTNAVEPMVITSALTEITPETAISGGRIIDKGGADIITRGICWSTSPGPTLNDSLSTDDLTDSTYTSTINWLSENTTYYVRAYATNRVGTGYGNEISFKTPVFSTNSDFKPTGMLPSTKEEILSIPTIESSGLFSALPMVKSSGNANKKTELKVPSPYNQNGNQNCAPAAVGYGMMSVLFNDVEGYDDYEGDMKKFSPFYIWNQLNIWDEIGKWFKTSLVQALNIVMDQGCCKLAYMPLFTKPGQKPTTFARENAAQYKLSIYRFEKYDVANYKRILDAGYPIVIGVYVDQGVMNMTNSPLYRHQNGSLIWKSYNDSRRAGHAMLIYGYNDENNAFKILNSWGDDFGNGGSFWIDYDFLKDVFYKFDPFKLKDIEAYVGIVKRPVTHTSSVTNITNTSAQCGGFITNDWNDNVTSKGVCWSENPDPTVSDSKISCGSGNEPFSCTLSGLKPGTTYYAKAFATNSQGIAYGKQQKLTTTSYSAPNISTADVASVNSSSAVVGGRVISNGGTEVTSRGVYYSNVIVALGDKVEIGSGTGAFSTTLTGLTPNTTYYVKAYATNNVGTSYGSIITFKTGIAPQSPTLTTTAPANITSNSATLGGNVTSAGSSAVLERGIVYATTQNPTTSNTKIASGSGTGTYSVNATNLTANTTYYYRAYAINTEGTAYGNEVTFSTDVTAQPPTVTTTAPANMTSNSATLGGNVTSTGSSAVLERGVVLATGPNPTISNLKFASGNSGVGAFAINVTNLTANTTYYYRAYAINNEGTAYGNEVTFSTDVTAQTPTVTTTAPANMTSNSATLGGNVTLEGSSAVIERGVVLATTQNPTTNNTKLYSGIGAGEFSVNATNLTANQRYYVRAYAINSQGVGYGNEVSFTTTSSSTFIKKFNYSDIRSIIQVQDNGYVFTANSNVGGNSTTVVKISPLGETVWERTITDCFVEGERTIIKSQDGGYYVMGITGATTSDGEHLRFIKIDANGTVIWNKVINEIGRGHSICATSDGGFIATNQYRSSVQQGDDIGVIKFDSEGNKQWLRSFGGSGLEYGNSIIQTADGGYAVLGRVCDSDENVSDFSKMGDVVIKIDANGHKQWIKAITGSVEGYSIIADGNNYVITGMTVSNEFGTYHGQGDIYLIKINSSGEKIWSKTYGGPYGEVAMSVVLTTDGGYFLAGTTGGSKGNFNIKGEGDNNVLAMKTDSNGNLIWINTFGIGWALSGIQSIDGGYVIVTNSVIKINSEGEL